MTIKNKCLTSLMLLTMLCFPINITLADDDENDYESNYERHDEEDEYDSDDEEYDPKEEDDYRNHRIEEPINTWTRWSKSSRPSVNSEPLPLTKQKEVSIIVDQEKSEKMLVIPSQGQLYIPLKEIADLLEVDYANYPKIHAAEMIGSGCHLIFKQGSRVVFENMWKTPMPGPTISLQDQLFVPVSVIATAYQYEISWQRDQTILLKKKGVEENG